MNAPQKLKRVVIAGGGTAGWIAAAALAKQLGSILDITLVESDEIGTVGVGEATIPTARTFHRMIGLDERQFMAATGATFKLGIAFENWARPGDRYVHSFGEVGRSTWMGGFQHMWLQARLDGYAEPIERYSLETQAAEAGRFAVTDKPPVNYAFHLDAGRYATFLRRLSEADGVSRVEGRIAGVEQQPETGEVAALTLEDGRRMEGDLFIDCTGFGGLLIGRTLGVGYEDWGHWLPTDRAQAVQTEAVAPPLPYTRAIAHDAGWQWRIPLQHRVGNGIVYASAHKSDDDARALLLGSIEGEPITEPRLIRYRTGRRLRVWEKNVVALGLSSGFVEPLESTSIHLIMIGITRLIQQFPFTGCTDALAQRYNDVAQNELERVRDFIILHYHLTERDDSPFWRQVRDMAVPDTLSERLALFREQAHTAQTADDLFRADSWLQVMLGQRLEPQAWHPMARMLGEGALRQALGDLKTGIAAAVARLPTHEQFLRSYAPAQG